MALPTRHKQKKKVEAAVISIDDFNRFGLQYKDFNGETFFKLDGTQIVMNYKCALNAEQMTASYRNYIKN